MFKTTNIKMEECCMKKSNKKAISTFFVIFVMVMTLIIPNASPFSYIVSASEYASRGIDVSVYNGDINWNNVANSDIDFAIIRAGTTNYNSDILYKDKKFEQNYSGATESGINVGAYYYCGAYTREGFEKTAYELVNFLGDKSFDLPVYIDLETASMQKTLGKDTLTSYILSALDIISNSGYKAGVYANRDWFRNYIDASRIRDAGYDIWMAQYPSGEYAVNPADYDKSSNCSIWQYSSLGKVNGIKKNVDVNVSYVDYSNTYLAAPKLTVSVNGDIATISWDKVKNATHYDLRLYYADGTSIYDNWGNDPNETELSFKLWKNSDYKVQVCSVDDDGNYVYCDFVYFSTGANESLIAPKLNVSVNGQVATISWDKTPNATRYDLRLYSADGTSIYDHWGNDPDETELSFKLWENSDYKVQVCSADDDGNYVYCDFVYFSTGANESLIAPKLNVSVNGQAATISWDKTPNATRYDLRLYSADGTSIYDHWGNDPNETELSFKLWENSDYKVQVCSADDDGNYVYCDFVYFSTGSSNKSESLSNKSFEEYSSVSVTEGIYYFEPLCAPNSCIDSEGGETLYDGYNHNIHLWSYLGNSNQQFSIEYAGEKDGKKLYYIKNTLTNQYLTMHSEQNLIEAPYKVSLAKWYFIDCGNGYYKIINSFKDLAIDIYGANSENGTNAWCYDPSDMNNSAQFFKLHSVS